MVINMSVRSRVNELIDSKNLEDAIKTVELRRNDVTTADLLSITTLLHKLIENKYPLKVLKVIEDLSKAPVFLTSSEFSSIIKGTLELGITDSIKQTLSSLVSSKTIKDCQFLMSFIEGAIDKLDFDAALDIINLIPVACIAISERNWESIISYFNKRDAIFHSAQVFKLVRPQLKSKRVWQDFIVSCIRNKNMIVAIELVHDVALTSEPSFGTELWNILLEKIVDESEMPCFEITKILNFAVTLGFIVQPDTLTKALTRLIIGEEQGKVIGYLKQLKSSATLYVVSKLLSKLIDLNLPREALELNNLVVLENFPLITVEKLELTNEKLKWLLRQQQLQLIKFIRLQKNEDLAKADDELCEDEFVFL